MVECENDGSKGGEGKVESHRQGRAVPQARALSGKLSYGLSGASAW